MAIRLVEVWNDDSKPYSEMFRDQMITIPAKSCIVMEDPDASQFMGQFVSFKRDGMGNQLGCKMLRKVYTNEAKQVTAQTVETQNFKCMACMKDLKDQKSLDAHVVTEHAATMIKDEPKEKTKSKFF